MRKRKWRDVLRLRRQLALAGIALVGVAAGIWAILIFPGNKNLESPASLVLLLHPKISLTSVDIDIYHDNDGNASIWIDAHSSLAKKISSDNMGFISLVIPGRFVTNCPTGVNCHYVSGNSGYPETTWIDFPLRLKGGNFIPYTARLHDLNFAFATNAESAIAQLPTATRDVSGSTTTTMYWNYAIPDVQSYDWSTPPWSTSQDFGFWIQDLNPGPGPQNQPGTEITGINRDRQAQDDRDTFISGVLLGIVGGAIIAMVQEGLHMLDDENHHKKG